MWYLQYVLYHDEICSLDGWRSMFIYMCVCVCVRVRVTTSEHPHLIYAMHWQREIIFMRYILYIFPVNTSIVFPVHLRGPSSPALCPWAGSQPASQSVSQSVSQPVGGQAVCGRCVRDMPYPASVWDISVMWAEAAGRKLPVGDASASVWADVSGGTVEQRARGSACHVHARHVRALHVHARLASPLRQDGR